jgi:hypothetical protein
MLRIVFLTIITGSGQRNPSASNVLLACSVLIVMVVSLVTKFGLDNTSEEKIFNNPLANGSICFNLVNKLVTFKQESKYVDSIRSANNLFRAVLYLFLRTCFTFTSRIVVVYASTRHGCDGGRDLARDASLAERI